MQMPMPVFKSIGSKTQLLPQLLARIPKDFERYVEPMVGGGSYFFALARTGRLAGRTAWLADANRGVYATYRTIQDNPELLIATLHEYEARYQAGEPSKLYYETRRHYNEAFQAGEEPDAAAFIFLRQTAFNGLWRHNQAGLLNMAWGKYPNPRIDQPENIRAASQALQGVSLSHIEAPHEVVQRCGAGDFVYVDPPYYGTFNKFTADGMSYEQHVSLLEEIAAATDRGARVLYSNADVTAITDAINRVRRGALIERVEARAKVNRDGAGRGLKNELLVTFTPQRKSRRRVA